MIDLSKIQRPDFDEETHTYRVDGRVVPSVTQILKFGPWKGVDETDSGFVIAEDVIENARERGHRVHKAIELLNGGVLDWDTVDADDLPYVEAYADWRDEFGYVAEASELIGYSDLFDYGFTLDSFGYLPEGPVVVDIKTGSAGLKPWHKYQLAAYAYPLTWEEEGRTRWPLRIMLHLKSNGKAKPYRFGEKTAMWDWEVFQSCRKLQTALTLDTRAA